MHHLLVYKMSYHLQRADADYLLISFVGPLKLQENSVDQDSYHVWQFGVEDGYQGGVDVGEILGGSLSLHD